MLNGLHLFCVSISHVLLKPLEKFIFIANCNELHPVYFHLHLARSHHTQLDLLSFVNEDYIAGYTQDGQMSTVRRFFCLFVAFDLFFISMLWFICIMVNTSLKLRYANTYLTIHISIVFQMNGDTILNALKVQVVHYSIQSSLFDIILAAFFRFALLIVFYGVFAMNHWSIIAVSLHIPWKL